MFDVGCHFGDENTIFMVGLGSVVALLSFRLGSQHFCASRSGGILAQEFIRSTKIRFGSFVS